VTAHHRSLAVTVTMLVAGAAAALVAAMLATSPRASSPSLGAARPAVVHVHAHATHEAVAHVYYSLVHAKASPGAVADIYYGLVHAKAQ
jgi:hypothetical protein